MPALPLDEAGKYVAGAYVVLVVLLLVYLAIMAHRVTRTERELAQLSEELQTRRDVFEPEPAASPRSATPERVA